MPNQPLGSEMGVVNRKESYDNQNTKQKIIQAILCDTLGINCLISTQGCDCIHDHERKMRIITNT